MTLFASRLSLQRSEIQALRMHDPYSVHRVVYSLFEDVRTEKEKQQSVPSGILYVDEGGNAKQRTILMISNRAPFPQVPCKDGSWVGALQSKEISASFLEHSHYRFKTVVNATRRSGATKKLVPIKTREDIHHWFSTRSQKDWGFQPLNVDVAQVNVVEIPYKGQPPITLSQAHIQGTLQVTDQAKFQEAFANGLGRKSAFGCGLLQLVPLNP